MSYRVLATRQFESDYHALDPEIARRVQKKLHALQNDPESIASSDPAATSSERASQVQNRRLPPSVVG